LQRIKVRGTCFPKNSADRAAATLVVHGQDQYDLIVEEEVVRTGSVHELKISDRIGSIQRKIYFDSGTLFETNDNDAVDSITKTTRHKDARSGGLFSMESSWTFAITAVLITGLLIAGFFRFGLPAAAHYAAHQVPVSAAESLSENVLEFMMGKFFHETELPESTQKEITERFTSRLSAIDDTGGFNYKLHFVNFRGIANAFALPSGDLVISDALVEMATADEVDSVLFHEIGHVVKRHGLQAVIKASAISVIATIALGDLSTLGELTSGMLVFLMQSDYSRKAEAEADDYALEEMMKQQMDPIHFATMMEKLSSQMTDSHTENNSEDNTEDNQKASYFDSHPATESRIEKARELSETYNTQ